MQHIQWICWYFIYTFFGCFIGHWWWNSNDATQCFARNAI